VVLSLAATRLRLPRPSQVENRSGQIAWYINRPIRNVLDILQML
jgi:hypothetical protein